MLVIKVFLWLLITRGPATWKVFVPVSIAINSPRAVTWMGACHARVPRVLRFTLQSVEMTTKLITVNVSFIGLRVLKMIVI